MFPRLSFPLLLATLALGSLADPVLGAEPELAKLLPRAQRVLIATPQQAADLREAGSMTVAIDRALRGRGRKEETVVVGHDGSLATPLFEEGQQYLMLLQPGLDDESGWTYVGASPLPYQKGAVVIPPADDQPAKTIELSDLIGLVNRYPSSPDAMIANRTSLNGRWVGEISMQGRNVPYWIVDVRDEEGMVSAEVVDFNIQNESVRIDSITMNDGVLNFIIVTQPKNNPIEHTYEFTGQLRDGVVTGNIITDNAVVRPGRLRATAAKKMVQTGGVKPSLGLEAFENAVNAEDSYAANQQFVKEYSESPLVLDAYLRMLKSDTAKGLEEQEIDALCTSFIASSERWGEWMRRQSIVDAGVAISEDKQHPKLAVKYLLEAEALMSEDTPEPWTVLIPFHTAMMYREIGDLDEASRRLKAYHQLHPYEPLGAYHAAKLMEKQEDFKGALQIYSELACLPKMKELLDQTFEGQLKYTPVEKKVLELWQEHGSTTGERGELVKHMVGTYREAIRRFATGKVEPRAPNPDTQNRVALLELFTTTDAPLAVGVDAAVSGLTHVFAPSELVALRYHINTDKPDPMTGPQCKDRLTYYGSRMVPAMYIEGNKVTVEAGHLTQAEKIYKNIRSLIEPILAETVDVELKLNANVEEDRLVIAAEALSPTGFNEHMRLRLALVEEELAVQAANGLLLHQNLVRIMPGGAEGIAPENGKLAFKTEITVADYRKQLNDELSEYEEFRSNNTGEEFRFSVRPIGPLSLKLAAFVQNDETKEILQAAIVDLEYSDPEEPPAADPKPDTDPKPEAEPKPEASSAAKETE